MHYRVVVFGVKDTTDVIIRYIQNELCPVDLIVTIAPSVTKKNDVSGYAGLSGFTKEFGIPVFEAKSYALKDAETEAFFAENTFDIGIVTGWQRLIPKAVLDRFEKGIFGFHGNCGYLPFGRGRSPLNWSMILGDTRFNLNLFRYDEAADSPNVFATQMFSINPHDTIRTAQYKNLIVSKRLIERLLKTYLAGEEIVIRTESRDFDSWYEKRTPADGKIDFHRRTREIYDLIRGVTEPFPGAFCYVSDTHADTGASGDGAQKEQVVIWEAHPFDEILDFSAFAPGEVIDVFDDKPVIRTVDGSLLIDRYEAGITLKAGMILQ